MIICPKCTKGNQDHYKFCLGCGAELPRDVVPKKFAPSTPPHGVSAARGGSHPASEETTQVGGVGTSPLGGAEPRNAPHAAPGEPRAAEPPRTAPPPSVMASSSKPESPAAAPASIACPQCEHENPPGNKFCASCGFKLGKLPAVAPLPAVPSTSSTSHVLLTALRADGSEAGSYPLSAGSVTLGRDTGSIFAGDSYLSPKHATFTLKNDKLFVRDESSLNGVYRKLQREQPVLIRMGDTFRIGQELLRVEPLTPLPANSEGIERMGSPAKGFMGRIALILGRDTTGNAYPIPESGLHLGRERGDVLFPEDGYVSGLHCKISFENGQMFLTDLGSSNGSFLRLMTETELAQGDILLMGQQLFRVTL